MCYHACRFVSPPAAGARRARDETPQTHGCHHKESCRPGGQLSRIGPSGLCQAPTILPCGEASEARHISRLCPGMSPFAHAQVTLQSCPGHRKSGSSRSADIQPILCRMPVGSCKIDDASAARSVVGVSVPTFWPYDLTHCTLWSAGIMNSSDTMCLSMCLAVCRRKTRRRPQG